MNIEELSRILEGAPRRPRPDERFVELQQQLRQLAAQEKAGQTVQWPTLHWNQVYNIKAFDFFGIDALKTDVVRALELLQSKPYGQKLFREMVMNELRTARVDLGAARAATPDRSGMTYVDFVDAVLLNPSVLQDNARFREEGEFIHDSRLTRVQHIALGLLHEGDHAVRPEAPTMYLDYTKLTDAQRAAVDARTHTIRPCMEGLALLRETEFRDEYKAPRATMYMNADKRLDMLERTIQTAARDSEEFRRAGRSLLTLDVAAMSAFDVRTQSMMQTQCGHEAEEVVMQRARELADKLNTRILFIAATHDLDPEALGVPHTPPAADRASPIVHKQ